MWGFITHSFYRCSATSIYRSMGSGGRGRTAIGMPKAELDLRTPPAPFETRTGAVKIGDGSSLHARGALGFAALGAAVRWPEAYWAPIAALLIREPSPGAGLLRYPGNGLWGRLV